MMLPVQWATSFLAHSALQVIAVAEPLRAPPLCIRRRAGLPLPPAAEYSCDMIQAPRSRAARTKAMAASGSTIPITAQTMNSVPIWE